MTITAVLQAAEAAGFQIERDEENGAAEITVSDPSGSTHITLSHEADETFARWFVWDDDVALERGQLAEGETAMQVLEAAAERVTVIWALHLSGLAALRKLVHAAAQVAP